MEYVSQELKAPLDYDSLVSVEFGKLQIMLEDYIMMIKKSKSPNSIGAYFYPVQSFCEANDIDLRWRKIKKLFSCQGQGLW